MGAALSCELCRNKINDSDVWVQNGRRYICVKCYDRCIHTDFVKDSTQLIISDENKTRLATEREIHRLLPSEVRDAHVGRRNFGITKTDPFLLSDTERLS